MLPPYFHPSLLPLAVITGFSLIGRSRSPPSSRGGSQMFQSILTPSSSLRCRGRGGISFQQALSALEGAKKGNQKSITRHRPFCFDGRRRTGWGTIKEYYSSPAQTYIIKLQLTSIKLRATRLDNFSDVVARRKRSLAGSLGWFLKVTRIIKEVFKKFRIQWNWSFDLITQSQL